jgi:putative addiction module component (TIGR02574 family)
LTRLVLPNRSLAQHVEVAWGKTCDSLTSGSKMAHTTIPEPVGFSELSKAEQIRYLQALWDRIAERPGEIPVPESHIAFAEERLAEYRRDPSRARSAYDVFDRLPKKDR